MSADTTRTAIIDAAFNVFSRKGYNAATTREIAAQAGVAEVTLFRHFKAKHDLLLELVNNKAVYNVENLKILLKENLLKPPAETLRIIIEDRFQVLKENQDLMRIGLTEAHHDPELLNIYQLQVIKPVQKAITQYLQAQIDRGCFREVNTTTAARLLMMLFISQVYDFPVLVDPPLEINTTAEELVDLYLRGLEKKP